MYSDDKYQRNDLEPGYRDDRLSFRYFGSDPDADLLLLLLCGKLLVSRQRQYGPHGQCMNILFLVIVKLITLLHC